MRRLLACAALFWFAGAFPALAQDITISLGEGTSLTERAVQLVLLVTALSLLPGLVIMVTCFPFLVTVLSILRQGLGLQSAPPNMLIVSLAMFLTFYIMEPVLLDAWTNGLQPFLDGALPVDEALPALIDPFRGFMEGRVDPDTYAALADLRPQPELAPGAPLPLATLVPSFLLSEIERAFQVGFLIFLPFLIIDLVVAAVLMSMGMMMVPPAIVALPFKLAFFVVADGWTLIAGALVQSYQ
jgi:flagellar biosynthesis protein FliP